MSVPELNAESLTARVGEIRTRLGDPPWGVPLMISEEMQAYLICQNPGHPTDMHYHQHDEWWVILEGELAWYFEDDPKPHHVKAGDFILAPRCRAHHIEVVGDRPSIRLAIGVRGEFHRYDRPGCHPVQGG